MKTSLANLLSCAFSILVLSALSGSADAFPSPDANAKIPGGRRLPTMPVDTFRTKSGEEQRVDWTSDAYVSFLVFPFFFSLFPPPHAV